jgi:class III poly(R)-hydroxyalkanoic acid synthase PhaE subunit
MDPFEYMKSLADFWSRSGAAFVSAQQNMVRDMAERAAKSGTPFPLDLATEAQRLTEAGEAFSKLWASALELSGAIGRGLQTGASPPNIVTEMLGKIFDPRQWFSAGTELDQSLQRMAEGPQLADLWQNERKFLAVFNAWLGLRRASLEHNTVVLDAWIRAAGAFAGKLNEQAEAGASLDAWREVLALWVETANQVMLENQRSEPFLKSQREVLKASTELRLAQQQVADFYSEVFGYPTRAELDDVHKTVTELRRELRNLRREMRAKPEAPDLAPGQAPEPAERPRTKKTERAVAARREGTKRS